MKILLSLILFLSFGNLYAQKYQPKTSSEIYEKVQKLNFLGTVLYVAAHPDDENTSMISHFSNNSHARVGYISLTRGDGGQNLIGSEIRELLGTIRTEELLAARRIDGGNQFFTRANDFGYSKQPTETFEFWDKDEVLSDLVFVIRQFQPDVIINRFDHRTPGTTHGHHTASAMLSVEAFDIANNKDKYPAQLKYVDVWQPTRQFYNTSWWFYGSHEKFDKVMGQSDFLRVNIGDYYPTRGVSNTEIAALSRSQHKSQGFGVAGSRGNQIEYLEPINGEWKSNYKTVFAGIDTTWTRIKGGAEIGEILEHVQHHFDFVNPANNLPDLLKAYQLIEKLEDGHWRTVKLEEIKEVIADCAGLFLEVSTKEENGTLDADIKVVIEAINRSNAEVEIGKVMLPALNNKTFLVNSSLENNEGIIQNKTLRLAADLGYTNPYWLNKSHSEGMYTVNNQELIGLPESPKQLTAVFNIQIDGVPIKFERAIIHKTTSPSKGEIRAPFSIVPDVSLEMNNSTLVFADGNSRAIKVDVKAFKDDVEGTLKLDIPNGWKVTPEEAHVSIDKKGKRQTVTFTLVPPHKHSEGVAKPYFMIKGKKEVFTNHVHVIDYSHIPKETVLLPTETKVIRLDIEKKGENIGYVLGAGDDVAKNLREIGYKVTEFEPQEITLEKLKQFDAVVLGIRAYDIDNDLTLFQDLLFEYAEQGGTLITQYNTLRELKTDKIAPYELVLSHDRVTDENSEVRFLAKNHPVLNRPNKITAKDFEGWVQERGLYFPSKWGAEFTPVLGMNDKGEDELKSSLLIAKYGKGYFVYTGLSFFRELPAGVSGAYRLFANLLSLGQVETEDQ